MRILFIDNDKTWLEYLEKVLNKEGYKVEIETDFEEAFEHTKNSTFDFIFYDSKAFCENKSFVYRLFEEGLNNRVIVTSSLPNYNEAMEAIRYGAIDYVEKFSDYADFIKIIEKNKNSNPINKLNLKRRLEKQ